MEVIGCMHFKGKMKDLVTLLGIVTKKYDGWTVEQFLWWQGLRQKHSEETRSRLS